jgi:anti-sigma B factor antagonist
VLDMSEVSFIDSSGLRVLVAQQQKSSKHGNVFEVVDASRAAHRLFEITGLAEVLGVRST